MDIKADKGGCSLASDLALGRLEEEVAEEEDFCIWAWKAASSP